MNETWNKHNPEYDYYKFRVWIKDNVNKSEQIYEAAYTIHKNTSKYIQYHCIYDDQEIKAIVFDKEQNSYLVILKQNNNYKILSHYAGYIYSKAFNIQSSKKSEFDY